MIKAEAVRTLIKKHLSKMEGNASLSTRKIAVLAKEAEEYFESLVVDLTGFTCAALTFTQRYYSIVISFTFSCLRIFHARKHRLPMLLKQRRICVMSAVTSAKFHT